MGLELARAYVSVGVNTAGVERSLQAVEVEAQILNRTFAQAVSWSETYSEALLGLNGHLVAGRISQEVYNKAIDQLNSQSPQAIAAAQAAAKAEQERAVVMQRGQRTTEDMMTSSQRYARNMVNLREELSAGAISQDVFNRAVRSLDVGHLKGVSSQLSEIGGTAAIMGGLVTAAFGSSARSAVMAAGKYEQTMIAFSTMMGSAQKASGLLGDLTKFAAETPFEMPEIEQVARGMVMFGEDSKTLMDTLAMLGNAASGTSSSFGMIGLIYNQIRGVGHLLTQDFRQLSTRGVISLRDIAKHYKITDAAAQEMISKGKVSFADFRSIMMELTSGSGRFSNMMQKQSQSMLGLLSTFSDAVGITMRQVGEEMVPVAKWFVNIGIQAVSSFSSMEPWMKKTIAATLGLGTVTAGLFTTMAAGAFTTGKLISAYTSTVELLARYAEVSKGAAAAQWALNASWAAAPYVLAAMGAALAVVVGYNLGKWYANSTEGAKKFDKTIKGISDEIEGQKAMGIDFTETSKGDVERFIDKTESKIAAAKARVKKLGGRWFGGGEEIKQEEAGIALMEDRIAKAREKLLGFAEAGGLPELTNQAEESKKSMNSLSTEVSAVNQRLEEARQKSKGSFTFGGGFDKSQFQQAEKNIEFYEKRLSELNSKLEAEGQKHRDLMTKIADTAKAADEKATAKIKEKTEALKIANDTYGMSAAAALAYKLAHDKVSDAEIKAHVAEVERTEALKEMKAAQEAATKEQMKWVEQLDKESQRGPAGMVPVNPFGPGGFDNPLSGMGEDFDELGRIMEDIKTPAEKLADVFSRLFDQKELLGPEVYAKALQAVGRSLTDSVMTPSEKATRQLDEWQQMLKGNAITQDTYNRLVKQMGQSVTESVNPAEALKTKTAELDALLASGAISQETYNKKLIEHKKAMRDAMTGTAGFAEFGQKIQDMLMGTGGPGLGMTDLQQGAKAGAKAGANKPPIDLWGMLNAGMAAQDAKPQVDLWGMLNAGMAAQEIASGMDQADGRQDEMVQLMIESNKGQQQLIAEVKKPQAKFMILGPG